MSFDHPWSNAPLRSIRRGHFWIPGERVARSGRTYQHAPMYEEWEAPEQVSHPYLIVTTEAGDFAAAKPHTAAFLNNARASAALMHLPDHGGHGNRHGLICEKNSDAVLVWLALNTEASA
ncbi:hypothetical protein [Gluconobacter sp. OJB]|uniref:hypothetical protein n=1 Tax=Gluconobacter sp. OJB TaxID=3145196 RepID=UPI0031F8BC2C